MELIVKHFEREEKVKLEKWAQGYRVQVGDKTYEIDVASIRGGSILSLCVDDGRQFEVAVRRSGSTSHGIYHVSSFRGVHAVEVVDPLTHLAEQSHSVGGVGKGEVKAYMPGRVVEILVAEGDEVEKGQGVIVLEAMKMKNEIAAERSGRVVRILVEPGKAVEGGDPLFVVE